MAQKIKVNTTIELDGTEYNITIAPVTKKARKKIEKAFIKEKETSQSYIDLENELSDITSELEVTQELIEATTDTDDKRKLILEKKELMSRKRELSKAVEAGSIEIREKISDMQEKMFETMFDEMVSGEDAVKLKTYVSEYSFEIAVKKIGEVYDKELEGK